MITPEQIKKIVSAIAENRKNYPSDAKHAASLGMATIVNSPASAVKLREQLRI